METYRSFARVYDLFMDNVPYEEWGIYIQGILKEYGVKDGIVLDLGCGTGKLTRILARQGYDMIGVDYSAEMLEIAREHEIQETENSGETTGQPEILYLLQDMREFELYGTVGAVISICDSMNYLLKEEEVLQVFRLVNNYLDPGGIFIFDLNTRYKYEQILGETTISENREMGSFIWDNYFDEESSINEYDLTLFIREKQDLYRKYEETHYQRAYDTGQIQTLLEKAGMELVAMYDAFTREPVKPESERIYVIAREHGKERKHQ